MITRPFPRFAGSWAATRPTLHRYAQAIGVVVRAHAPARPHWFHVSLKVSATGLVTDPVVLADGGLLTLRMDFRDHAVHLETSHGDHRIFAMTDGASGTQFGDTIVEAARRFGLNGPFARDRYESDATGTYDPAAAEVFWEAIAAVAGVFATHNASLVGEVGPVQVWPHGFDLATEWFGDGDETWSEGDDSGSSPRQINLGFYPGDSEQYFYSNPWPLRGADLTSRPLPHGAEWITDEFEGSKLAYSAIAEDPEGPAKLADYARAVWVAASPGLMCP